MIFNAVLANSEVSSSVLDNSCSDEGSSEIHQNEVQLLESATSFNEIYFENEVWPVIYTETFDTKLIIEQIMNLNISQDVTLELLDLFYMFQRNAAYTQSKSYGSMIVYKGKKAVIEIINTHFSQRPVYLNLAMFSPFVNSVEPNRANNQKTIAAVAGTVFVTSLLFVGKVFYNKFLKK